MKFIDLFSGIGGFRLGLERAGHECIGHVEIDKYARKSYEAMHNAEGEWVKHDITTITNEEWAELKGRVDIIAGGFPCQAFSIAGKRGGFEDTRGTLFFDIARAAKEIQPSYLFLENVKGLFSHDKGRTFGTIIQALDELGYFVEWGLFNSKFWGVPQNRERVFIVATRKDVYEKPILFDLLKQQEQNGVNVKLRDILETEVDEKFYLSKEQTDRLVFNMGEREKSEDEIKILAHRKNYRRNTQVFDKDGLTETLDTGQGGGRGHYTMEDPIKVIGSTQKNAAMTDGSHSPTLTSSMGSGGGHVPMMVFEEPKVVEQQTVSYNRKDGVGKEIKIGHTLMARDYKGFGNQDMSAVVEVAIGASRGRNPENPSDRTTEQRLEINQDGTSNTLTSVQKDNYVISKPPF
ncbi:DNA cytosine methyltransferase [Jeotgalibaca porci]|uniref:DNA cytosine methyltransferase n=1 Tax=Jeotgalibaca porci TaxID=1868793 RepID=UPI00359FA013